MNARQPAADRANPPDQAAGAGLLKVGWHRIEPDKINWLYSGSSEDDAERGCIGHLRGDFGSSGKEFWGTWFGHKPELQTIAFREELQIVVDQLRVPGGLLSDFNHLRRQCTVGTPCDDSYGFHAETANYEYCLRCLPQRGSYNMYLYCYDKSAQRDYALRRVKQQPLRDRLKQPVQPAKTNEHRATRPER